jgi:hypothetical protein
MPDIHSVFSAALPLLRDNRMPPTGSIGPRTPEVVRASSQPCGEALFRSRPAGDHELGGFLRS